MNCQKQAALCLVWAQGRDGAIGVAGKLPWHLPDDLRHFKALTKGCPVIMGRKTWDSLPHKPLPDRMNIVVSRSSEPLGHAAHAWCGSLKEALRNARTVECERIFIIGGAELYALALPYVQEVHRTWVDIDVPEADTFAPQLSPDWLLRGQSDWSTSQEGLRFRFEILEPPGLSAPRADSQAALQ